MFNSWRNFLIKYRSQILILLLLILSIKVLVPQLDDLRNSIEAIKGTDLLWIILGILIYFTGLPILAVQMMSVALKPIKFLLTLKVQMACLFVGKLLPNGIGSISLNVYYLIKQKHTPNQAATAMTMNAILSAIAYVFLIIYAMITSSLTLDGIKGNIQFPLNLVLLLIVMIIGIGFIAFRSEKIRRESTKIWNDLKTNFSYYKSRPKPMFVGIVCNALGSLTSIFALLLSAKAIGVNISFAEALLAYTFGNIAAALIPTPGGIGAVEAGIYAGLVLVGIEGAQATIITLIFRLITYWIPILPGYYYFWNLRKSLLLNYKFGKNYSS